jgi:DNA helicase-2/ATP-dependent DNA helicase PcrA
VLYTNNPEGEKITVYTAHNDLKEASYIASEILRLQSKGTALNDIAILYRTNLQSEVIMQTLQQMQIPFYVSKGQRFFERQEIKTVLCYLQLALDAQDNASFDYVVNVPQRGIVIATKQKISSYAGNESLSYWKACELMMQSGLLTGKALQGILEFMTLNKMLGDSMTELSLVEAVQFIIDKTGLLDWYARFDDGSDRLENLDELLKIAGEFKADEALELSIMEQFLAHACLSNEEETGNGVQLMTLHASKGLEFDTVFLIGLEQNLFPSKKGDLEEERRLMYVAITRAKQRLVITHARQRQLYGSTMMQRPSVFLSEIPSSLVTLQKDKPAVTLKMPEGIEMPRYAYN